MQWHLLAGDLPPWTAVWKQFCRLVDIRRRSEGTRWFVPLQPLWRVERTFAWLGRNRCLRHDYEATVTSSQTFAHANATAFTLNRLHPAR